MSFFEPLPPWRPPAEPRMPTWARGPEDMIPGVVPGALLVARTATHAVLIDGLLVYPTGFDFDLAVRRRPGHPRQHHDRGHRWGDDLHLEVRFADGRRADNHPRRWPHPTGDRLPDPPLLYQSTSGPDGGHVWLWGLPPPGPLTFACHWPTEQIPPSEAVLDAGLVLAAAARAQTLWPGQASSP
jgi:hypothetical protein